MEKCTAHDLLTDTVQGLRENQKETYTLIRTLTADVAKNTQEMSNSITELSAWRESFEQRQEEKHLELKFLIKSTTCKKWTPQNTIALIGALFGGGGVATVLVLFLR